MNKIEKYPKVQWKKSPFYYVVRELLKPSILHRNNDDIGLTQECTFYFSTRTPKQVYPIRNSQIQIRFSVFDSSRELDDQFPPNVQVTVNEKPVSFYLY